MAKNTGRGSRTADAERTRGNTTNGALWVRRNAVTGRFDEAKKSGGAFKGARRDP